MARDGANMYISPFLSKSVPFPEADLTADGSIDLMDINYANNQYPILQNYFYSPFGELWQGESSTDTNPFRYCGEYYDSETGLIYLRARYYDPSIGRFISEDPIKDGTNWYVYCSNNPVAFVDPSGLVPVETIIDFASLGWSLWHFMHNPNIENFGYLAWDALAFITPYVPGSYISKVDNIIESGTKILSKADDYQKTGVWAMKAFDRGWEIEKALGGMCNTFPTIDKFLISHASAEATWLSHATSIKSLDLTATTYQNASALKSRLKGYVDNLISFWNTGTSYKSITYKMDPMASSLTLELAIPPVEMTSSQIDVFQYISDYANENGIEFLIRIVE